MTGYHRVVRFCGSLLVALCLLAIACGSPSPKGEAPKAVLPGIPPVLRFRPPADGLLTEGQLDRYIRVRRATRGRSEEETARAHGVDLLVAKPFSIEDLELALQRVGDSLAPRSAAG